MIRWSQHHNVEWEPELIAHVFGVVDDDEDLRKDDTERWMCHQDFAPSMFLSMQLKDIGAAVEVVAVTGASAGYLRSSG